MSTASATVTIHVPLVIRRRGGGKVVITPAAETCGSIPQRARVDPSLVKALARAHRWKRQLEEGLYGSITEMAAAERIDRGYVGNILRLTLLAPDIVEGILNGAPARRRSVRAPETVSAGMAKSASMVGRP